ncbi:LOG family protein [Georgenia soli]|uniref:LOG family protein n=1 Tax=Georgenia soli TaxID=638953 RepID=UPI000BF346E5|nr:LOG family protein [Georgenia soli]
MKEERGSTVEVESLEEFDGRVAHGAGSITGWHLQGVDLRGRGDVLRRLDVTGALLLGCALEPADEQSLRARGALVFPVVPDIPFDAYRGSLYTAEELYAGLDGSYDQTLDARVYAWSRQGRTLVRTLAQALHDHAVDDALVEVVRGSRIVGVMGGHAVARGTAPYADAARLARELTREGLVVGTGGGPGAMEAANLGAYLAHRSPADLDAALAMVAAVPSFVPSVQAWARAALDVRERWPEGARSLGIPTWHYGHEPPNAFATVIAKYFRNAIREAVLLHVASAGIVFLPGAAGTVQEVFQDACENYYADASSVAPMVLVGREHWTRTLPVWPLLESLARERHMVDHIHLVDDVSEVPALLTAP